MNRYNNESKYSRYDNHNIIDVKEGRDFYISSEPNIVGPDPILLRYSIEIGIFYLLYYLCGMEAHNVTSTCFWGFMATSLIGGLIGAKNNYLAEIYLFGTIIGLLLPGDLFYLPLVIIGIYFIVQLRKR